VTVVVFEIIAAANVRHVFLVQCTSEIFSLIIVFHLNLVY